jgi:hypothetical protein
MRVVTAAPDDPTRYQRHSCAMPAALRRSPAQLARPALEHGKRTRSSARAEQAGDGLALPASGQPHQPPHVASHRRPPTKASGTSWVRACLQAQPEPAQPLSHCLVPTRRRSLRTAQWPLDAPSATVQRSQARPLLADSPGLLAASVLISPIASLRRGKECAR